MKTSLQLKMSQQLTMTPQLQQAIKLLQLSTLDLQQEIQQALDTNPMLEVKEDDGSGMDSINEHHNNSEPGPEIRETQSDEATKELNVQETIPDDLAVDSSWDDIYTHTPTSHGISSADDEYNLENVYGTTDSLLDHLHWQLERVSEELIELQRRVDRLELK